ncbi:MAG: hypothetical protein QM784_30975 [Polyangiaceae bacterium]
MSNPFLELYRKLIDRFPTLWVLDPGFPGHLSQLMEAMRRGDEEAAIDATRQYYDHLDHELIRLLDALLSLRKLAASRDDLEPSAPSDDLLTGGTAESTSGDVTDNVREDA